MFEIRKYTILSKAEKAEGDTREYVLQEEGSDRKFLVRRYEFGKWTPYNPGDVLSVMGDMPAAWKAAGFESCTEMARKLATASGACFGG